MMNIISANLMGGLGNCLFQIAAAYATSLRDSKKFVCPKVVSHGAHKPIDHYLNNIFSRIEFGLLPSNIQMYYEPCFHYSEIPYIHNNTMLYGYFQSEKYFGVYRDDILNLFSITEEIKNKLTSKYSHLLQKKTCSIHIRRGDYVRLSDSHTVQPIDYYKKATNIIGNGYEYLIFSDDIEWCKQNFSFLENTHFIESDTDFENLYLMSMCDHNIIANSTFSWWGAWLNTNEDKKVVCPSDWFGPINKYLQTKDIFPENWIVI